MSPVLSVTPTVPTVPLGALADWAFVLRNAGYLAGGLAITIALTIASVLLGFAAGFPAGILEVYGGRYTQAIVGALGVFLRGTPLVVLIIVTFFVVGVSPAFLAATFALGFRSAAYQSQIFRGAIESVSGGQTEAARAVGLSRFQTIRHVVVPQALRRSIPGFQNEFTIVLKDTSIAFAIGLAELLTRSYDLFVQRTTAVLDIVLFISLLYFLLTFGTNRALDALGERFAIPGGEG